MAITDIAAYAHLSPTDIEALGAELDTIRRDVEESRGAKDAAYIRRAIVFQRALDIGARLLIAGSRSRTGWLVGTASLAYAKCIENMELAHNISHGQWDWMNDPEIHSTTWEWDQVGPSSQWRYSHNYRHHVFSNVVGVDDDLGFGVMRVTRDQQWKPEHLLQPLRNVLLAATFEWGIALHDFYSERDRAETEEKKSAEGKLLLKKIARQTAKDYLFVPALSGRRWRRTLGANASANLLRNIWTNVVILCGHFPDGAEKFTEAVLDDETSSEWYLRQMMGAANVDAGPAAGVLDRQPVLPDRAPPVPRPAEQPLPGDRRAGAGAVRQVRPALHEWLSAASVLLDAAHHPQVGAARRLAARDVRRRPGNRVGTEVLVRFGRIRLGDSIAGQRSGLRTALRHGAGLRRSLRRARTTVL